MNSYRIGIYATASFLGSLPCVSHAAETTPKYLDPKVPIEQRVDDLLPRLTLEEKVIQLSDSWGSKGIERLKVPALLKTEGLHSQSYSTGATNFPQSIAMATTFDPELIQKVGKAIAIEAKAANLRVSWSPVLDVARDARWGRVEETYGEDPFLVGRMGVAWINGFQGENMIAVPKHVAGHGEPLGGRDSNDVGLSDRVMRNIHLAGFRAAVKEAHAGGAMAAYGTWNGVPDNASVELLQKVLREEWGFDGMVVSDCSGPENFMSKQAVAENLEEACRMAIHAGVDMECGNAFKIALASAVRNGVLSESELDPNLRNVFRAKFRLGLFENPQPEKMVWEKLPEYDTPEHRALAREVAVKGSVLLKNDKKLLPLDKAIKTIAVIGPNADVGQTGDYSPKFSPGQVVTVLQGVKSHVSPDTKVLYARGCDVNTTETSGIAPAVEIAKQSDVVILVVGDSSAHERKPDVPAEKETTGENVDGATLEIPGVQRQLIKEIQATGKPVVLVLVNGKPFTLAWEAENIAAILETWYPGEEGGNATADLIFGDRNPAGRLPITFPRHVGQVPLRYNYEPSGRNYGYYDMSPLPLYRFGHGLSYTTFNYTNFKATPKSDDPGFVSVSVDIENTGDRDGDEVAQLYITDLLTSVVTPVIQLEGIKRVALKKGEKKSVIFELTPYQLSLLDPGMVRVLEPGKFRIHVGGVSPEPPSGNKDHKTKIGFKKSSEGITGEIEVPRKYAAEFVHDLKPPATARGGENFPVTVTVTNRGNLLDVAEVKLYGDKLLGTRRFEIEPGETRTHTFDVVLFKGGPQNLTAIVGEQTVGRVVEISRAPAKLVLSRVRTTTGDDGTLRYAAAARNVGSNPYKGNLDITVDGKVVASQAVELEAGAQRDLLLSYAFPRSGSFRVKAGDAAEQVVVVPGGIGLALEEPLMAITFDGVDSSSTKDEVSGAMLAFEGTPKSVPGKTGNAFKTDDKKNYLKAGGLDLYRKSFTLAAWVNVEKLDNGQAAFFGGQAPMGADVDNSGTGLIAGVVNNKLLLSFQGRDSHGKSTFPAGKWVHVAFAYDVNAEQGSLYLDGKLDGTEMQKSYAGPLDMIGGSQRFSHGKYAIDDVLVTRSCLPATAIKELASKGIEALRGGQVTTEWRPVSSSMTALDTWAEIPAGTSIKVSVDSGDKDNKTLESKTFDLKPGAQSVPLAGLKPGSQIRLRVQLATTRWGAMPVLQTATIKGTNETVRWSVAGEWKKVSFSGGVKVGR